MPSWHQTAGACGDRGQGTLSKLTISSEQSNFGERRPVTVLCYDLVGSTELLVISDLEDFQELTRHFHRSVKSIVERHGGTIRDTAGDGGLAVFGLARRSKDAASEAVEAGLSIVDACADLSAANEGKLHVRIGVSSSPVVIDRVEGIFDLSSMTGIAPVIAARLQTVAAPDSVVVSRTTRALSQRSHKFRNLGQRALKGLAEPVEVWEPSRHRKHRDRFRAFGSVTGEMVGRAAERKVLAESWAEAVAGRGRVLFVEGDAGMGKSRLLHELREITRERRHGLFEFQCLQSAESNALHPLVNAVTDALSESHKRLSRENIRVLLRRFGASDDQTADVLSELLVPAASNNLFPEFGQAQIQARLKQAVRNAAHLLCRRGPIIIAIEDLHWADLMSLDALEALADMVSELPLLVAITSRRPPPERLAIGSFAIHILLQPFTPQETRDYWMSLVADADKLGMIGGAHLLHVASGGVPLFVEEISAWAAQAKADDIGQRNWAQMASKPNFEALLAERLGDLGYKQQIAQYAAVVGQNFDAHLLGTLGLSESEAEIDATLDTLEGIGIVERVRLGGHDVFGFRHALIQEAIYEGLLRKTRRYVHQRIAEAIGRDASCAPWMTKSAAANHAEQGGLVLTAIKIYIEAGAESAARFALQDARQHCEHALQLLTQWPRDDRTPVYTLAAMRILGPVIINLEGARSPSAIALYNDGVKLVRHRPKGEQAEWFPIYWGWWFTGSTFAEQHDRAVAVLEDLSEVKNSEIQMQARHCKWAIDFNLGLHASCLKAVDEGLSLYGESASGPHTQNLYGGHDPKVCGLAQRSLSLWLTGHYSQARAAMEEARAWADHLGHAGSIAHAMDFEAMLNWYRRDAAALASVTQRMAEFAEEHKLPAIAHKAKLFDGWVTSHNGKLAAGLHLVQDAIDALQAIETAEDMPVYLDIQAELHSRSGDREKALALLTAAIADARQAGHSHWLAELQRHAGELLIADARRHGEAIAMLNESLNLAASQNAVPLLLNAWTTLESADHGRQPSEEHMALIHAARALEAKEGPR
jgi:predicted ATPase/class 3 adenylate cyclase